MPKPIRMQKASKTAIISSISFLFQSLSGSHNVRLRMIVWQISFVSVRIITITRHPSSCALLQTDMRLPYPISLIARPVLTLISPSRQISPRTAPLSLRQRFNRPGHYYVLHERRPYFLPSTGRWSDKRDASCALNKTLLLESPLASPHKRQDKRQGMLEKWHARKI